MQALSAVLGGTQSLHTNSMDEALGLPTESAALLALRTQQVLAYETGVADTIDPLAGSYFVEQLTDEIERGAEEYLQKIDDLGGAVAAIEKGYQQREIHEAAYSWQKKVDAVDEVVVGVNKFTNDQELKPEILKIDPDLERDRRARLAALRDSRDASAAQSALETLRSIASSDGNLMPVIVAAVEARCTLGEIADQLREVFGVHRDEFSF